MLDTGAGQLGSLGHSAACCVTAWVLLEHRDVLLAQVGPIVPGRPGPWGRGHR